jgi:hypothetical protein
MFRVVFHPSSGARDTLSTVSGINETATATRGERRVAVAVSLMPDTVDTVLRAPDDG